MTDIETSVASHLAHIDGTLIVGVSGGADSVALLRLLHALNRDIVVVTCDFHLRGEESTADRKFVAQLCRDLGVECIEADMDVEGHMARHSGSVEMACRELRYSLFAKLMYERSAKRTAVAHNADDNIETLFLNLMRGAGVEGLRGMLPDNGMVIRPLLDVSRKRIEQYLREINQPYRTDSTNSEDKYSRNYIRHNIIPLLEKRWPAARKSITTTLRNLRGEAKVISRATTRAKADMISWEEIENCGDALTYIQRFMRPFKASASQIEEMCHASTTHSVGKMWILPDVEIHSERDGLHLVRKEPLPIPEYHWITIPNTVKAREYMRSCRDQRICWLPEGSSTWKLRHPEEGDRISPLGMKGSSRVSGIMKDAGLTRNQRRQTVLLTDNEGKIVWIDGLKRSRHYLISDTDREIHITSADKNLLCMILLDLDT